MSVERWPSLTAAITIARSETSCLTVNTVNFNSFSGFKSTVKRVNFSIATYIGSVVVFAIFTNMSDSYMSNMSI